MSFNVAINCRLYQVHSSTVSFFFESIEQSLFHWPPFCFVRFNSFSIHTFVGRFKRHDKWEKALNSSSSSWIASILAWKSDRCVSPPQINRKLQTIFPFTFFSLSAQICFFFFRFLVWPETWINEIFSLWSINWLRNRLTTDLWVDRFIKLLVWQLITCRQIDFVVDIFARLFAHCRRDRNQFPIKSLARFATRQNIRNFHFDAKCYFRHFYRTLLSVRFA